MIVDQPEERLNILPGDNVMFSVTTTGKSLSYQWQKDGDELNDGDDFTGSKESTLTVVDVKDPDDEGTYNVIVMNNAGFVISVPVELTVGKVSVVYSTIVGLWNIQIV